MEKPLLSLVKINKYFGDLHILQDLSIDIYPGEFLTLLGPSGCGKTTILRSIAGFEPIDSGDVLLNGESIVHQPANKRNINTVFQNYALFPHLSVYENIAYGPKVKGTMEDDELQGEVKAILELVQMEGYGDRMPDQLSGGQMQRIAIGRALINKPAILLLDEPLGALDLKLRKHMQYELSNIQKRTGTTFIYVTHDQDEALNMSDRLAVMQSGRIEQLSTPREAYNNPKNFFVADFVGERNILKVHVIEQTAPDAVLIELGGKKITAFGSKDLSFPVEPGQEVLLAAHVDKMVVACEHVENSIPVTVKSVHYSGSQIRTEVEIDGNTLRVVEYSHNDCDYKPGDTIYVTWQKNGAVILPLEETEEIISERNRNIENL